MMEQLSIFDLTMPYISVDKPIRLIELFSGVGSQIGAETGHRKNKVIPERKWIEHVVNKCRESNIPVFMKSSLADIWGEPLIQEFPDELKRK